MRLKIGNRVWNDVAPATGAIILLVAFAFLGIYIASFFYGVYLAFVANIILGLAVVFIKRLRWFAFAFGFCGLFFDVNLAQVIVTTIAATF